MWSGVSRPCLSARRRSARCTAALNEWADCCTARAPSASHELPYFNRRRREGESMHALKTGNDGNYDPGIQIHQAYVVDYNRRGVNLIRRKVGFGQRIDDVRLG